MPRPQLSPRQDRRRARSRPLVERLEARELMANAGVLDPTFGLGKGFVLTDVAPDSLSGLSDDTATLVEPDGSILVDGPVGVNHTTFGLVHLEAKGTIDFAFGSGGEADVVLPAGLVANGPPTSLLVQPDGKVLLVGIAQTTDLTPKPVTIVARFDAKGRPDPTYGIAGVVVLDEAAVGTPGPTLSLAALQVDGQLVLAGIGSVGTTSTTQVVSIRLTPLGALDSTYGTGRPGDDLRCHRRPAGRPDPGESAVLRPGHPVRSQDRDPGRHQLHQRFRLSPVHQ